MLLKARSIQEGGHWGSGERYCAAVEGQQRPDPRTQVAAVRQVNACCRILSPLALLMVHHEHITAVLHDGGLREHIPCSRRGG